MTSANLLILGLSLTSLAFLSALQPVRQWFRGFKKFPGPAFLLLLLLVGIFFLGGAREPGSELVDPLRVTRMALFVTIVFLAFLDLLARGKAGARVNSALWLMLCYGIVAMATAAYSTDPLLTAWKGFEVITHVLVAMAIARRIFNTEDALTALGLAWLGLAFATISVFWGIVLFPDDALRREISMVGFQPITQFTAMYGGVFPRLNPNEVTQIAAIMTLAAFSYTIAERTPRFYLSAIILLGISLVDMYFSHGRTSFVAALLAVFVIAIFSGNKKAFSLVAIGLILFIFISSFSEYARNYFLRGQTEEELGHLSGRVPFWKDVWEVFSDRPLFGYGYYSAQRELFNTSGVDNSYLNVLLGGGILLLTIFVAPIVLIATQIFRYRPSLRHHTHDKNSTLLWMLTSSLFILLIVRSATGPSFESHHHNLILFLLCSVAASRLGLVHKSQKPVSIRHDGMDVTASTQTHRTAAKRQ